MRRNLATPPPKGQAEITGAFRRLSRLFDPPPSIGKVTQAFDESHARSVRRRQARLVHEARRAEALRYCRWLAGLLLIIFVLTALRLFAGWGPVF